jgi:hypothetical protein
MMTTLFAAEDVWWALISTPPNHLADELLNSQTFLDPSSISIPLEFEKPFLCVFPLGSLIWQFEMKILSL